MVNAKIRLEIINSMTILDKAIVFATEAHSGIFRKGGKTPYIVHPMEVAAIAARMTDDIEVITAAVLHDVIEDTTTTAEQLEKMFGKRVAELVLSDSDDKQYGQSAESWEIRKTKTLARIPKANRGEQIVILSDKLSNLRSIYHDYIAIGDKLWERFHVKDKAKQKWYYCGIAEQLNKVKDTNAFKEYLELLFAVFGTRGTFDIF